MNNQIMIKGLKKGFCAFVFYVNPYNEEKLFHCIEGQTQERVEEYQLLIKNLIEKGGFFGRSFSKSYPKLRCVVDDLYNEGRVSSDFKNIFENLSNKNNKFVDGIFGHVVRNFVYDDSDTNYPRDLVANVYDVTINYFENDVPPIFTGK